MGFQHLILCLFFLNTSSARTKTYLIETRQSSKKNIEEYGEDYAVEYDEAEYSTEEWKAVEKMFLSRKKSRESPTKQFVEAIHELTKNRRRKENKLD